MRSLDDKLSDFFYSQYANNFHTNKGKPVINNEKAKAYVKKYKKLLKNMILYHYKDLL